MSVLQNSSIIVTGGCGFIGFHIAKTLLEMRNRVLVLDDLSTGQKSNLTYIKNKGAKIKLCSLADYESIVDCFKDVDYVFHQAAIPSVPRSISNPAASHIANINGTFNLLEACRNSCVKKVVYASSSSAYGNIPVNTKNEEMAPDPLSPYAVQKLTGEYYCKVYNSVYGLPVTILRYFNVYGPRQNPHSKYSAVIPTFIRRILDSKPPVIFGDGKQSRNFTYVKDVVDANLLSLGNSESNGRVINVASGVRTTVNELAEIIINRSGKRIKPVYKKALDGEVKDSHADIKLAKKLINFEPRIGLKEGIDLTYKYYVDKG